MPIATFACHVKNNNILKFQRPGSNFLEVGAGLFHLSLIIQNKVDLISNFKVTRRMKIPVEDVIIYLVINFKLEFFRIESFSNDSVV